MAEQMIESNQPAHSPEKTQRDDGLLNVGNLDEIDIVELWNIVWRGRLLIIAVTALFAIGSLIHAYSIPDQYRSEILVFPSADGKGGGLAGLAAQIGGLAGMAGFNISSSAPNKAAVAIAVLKSREFIRKFIQKYSLKAPLIAAVDWDTESQALIYDDDIYDHSQRRWQGESDEGSAEPSDLAAYNALIGRLSVSQDKVTGLITIGIKYYSPTIAREWVNNIVLEVNSEMKRRDMAESQRNIEYLKQQLNKTSLTEIQAVFYRLIEEQTKALMMAEVQDEYYFKVIDPAVIPEERAGPKRRVIVMSWTMAGGLIGLAMVFAHFYYRKYKNNSV